MCLSAIFHHNRCLHIKNRLLADARFLYERLSAARGAASLNNMLETIVQEKPVMRKSVLNPNGVVNSPGGEGNTGTPRPRGSIDLDGLQKSKARQNSTNVSSAMPNNLAARPSPFAKRGLASLFGGATASGIASSNNASSSSLNLASDPGVITREGSPGLGVPSGGALMIGSSGGVTPNMEDGRASPIPSPPRTPGSASFSPRQKPTSPLVQGDNSSTTAERGTQEGAGDTEGPISGHVEE
jgi:hypothetical protein